MERKGAQRQYAMIAPVQQLYTAEGDEQSNACGGGASTILILPALTLSTSRAGRSSYPRSGQTAPWYRPPFCAPLRSHVDLPQTTTQTPPTTTRVVVQIMHGTPHKTRTHAKKGSTLGKVGGYFLHPQEPVRSDYDMIPGKCSQSVHDSRLDKQSDYQY